jgi:putative membrane protein
LPADWLTRWNFDPLLLLALSLLAHAAFRWSAPGRRHWLAAAFGLVLLLFVSPFCALTSALFSARVTHHVLLTAVVAPVLAFSIKPGLRVQGSLAFWTGVQALLFWVWHAPPFYAAALSSNAVYWAMQATLLGSAMCFWLALRRASATSAVAGLLATTIQMGLLGALITFAASPLYAPHLATTEPWGFSPLEDQQLAGLIMWVPSAGIYLAAALFVARRWLADDSRVAAR